MDNKKYYKFFTRFAYSFLFLLVFYLMNPQSSFDDPDTFWHLELGRQMLAQGHLITEAIHTFAGAHLAYIPHELGFQLIIAKLFNWWGWSGLHLLSLSSIFLLTWGLYRLCELAAEESGLTKPSPAVFFLILPITVYYIFSLYITIRPQMVSLVIILWFFIWLLRFRQQPSWIGASRLGLFSLLLSNVHTGVWPVIVVFLGMYCAELVLQRALHKYALLACGLVLLGGVVNLGGWETITYFWTLRKSPFTTWVAEWKPIIFASRYTYYIDILLLSWGYSTLPKKDLFKFFLFAGILYLGLANYKQHLFAILFLPYFVTPFFSGAKWHNGFAVLDSITNKKYIFSLILIGLIINFSLGLRQGYELPKRDFPVEEMDYILSKVSQEQRPKVLAEYGSSGYVMYRGGDILADGRFDPFILPQTKSINNWTALERSAYAFKSHFLLDVIKADRPDFLIVPTNISTEPEDSTPKAGTALINADLAVALKQLGAPVFRGKHGSVWDLRALDKN